MTRDEAVTRIRRYLVNSNYSSAVIIDALKDAQVELEESPDLPWFLKTEISSIETVAGEERIPVPSDFLMEWEKDALWYFIAGTGGDYDVWKPLVKLNLQDIRSSHPGAGAPQAYSLNNLYFRIGPEPDDTYTLKMVYYARDAVLTSNIENKWLKYAHDLMIGEAGKKLAGLSVRDPDAYQQFGMMAQTGRLRLYGKDLMRNEANSRPVMGMDAD